MKFTDLALANNGFSLVDLHDLISASKASTVETLDMTRNIRIDEVSRSEIMLNIGLTARLNTAAINCLFTFLNNK
jgi:hypothetical protein